MDFREVCASFGGSIFHEEFKGDVEILDFEDRIDSLQRPEGATGAEIFLIRGLLASIVSFLRGQGEDAEIKIELLLHATLREWWSRMLRGYLRFARSVKFCPLFPRFKPRVSDPTTLLTRIEDPDLAPESKTAAMRENMDIGVMMILADDKPIDLNILERALYLQSGISTIQRLVLYKSSVPTSRSKTSKGAF